MASYTQYDEYGGNPYSDAEQGLGGVQTNESRNASRNESQYESHEMSSISNAPPPESRQQSSTYVAPLSQQDFLKQVAVVRDLLKDFDNSLAEVSTLHLRLLDSTDTSSTTELGANLQHTESQTFARNEQIRRAIKTLAQDAANTTDNTKDMKVKQVSPLKREFQTKIATYQTLEKEYGAKRQEQIRRQFLIVNPDATDGELAAVADASSAPGSQSAFQMALSNRRGVAQTALGAVEARHNELQRIERTIMELAAMFNDMDQIVVAQEPAVERTEEHVTGAQENVSKGNVEVGKAIKHARNRNKLKWWCLLVVVLIVLAIALGVGLGVGLSKASTSKTS